MKQNQISNFFFVFPFHTSITPESKKRAPMTASVDLAKFDQFFSSRSYVEGYAPSNLDLEVFDALKSAPSTQYVHALVGITISRQSKLLPIQSNPMSRPPSLLFLFLPLQQHQHRQHQTKTMTLNCSVTKKPKKTLLSFAARERKSDSTTKRKPRNQQLLQSLKSF